MVKKIIFQDSYLVSGIMCHQGCGATIKTSLNDLEELKQRQLLPADAELIIDAEPQGLGIHRLLLQIESAETSTNTKNNTLLYTEFKNKLDLFGYNTVDSNEVTQKEQSNWVNWLNILVNLLSMATIGVLTLVFPPSILLTCGLTTLSFITTAFTSRQYLINFFHNLKTWDWANMSTTIALGWFLSLSHTLYHSITMPLAASFSMLFMSYLMPILLIAIINGMDEIKRLISNKSKEMRLKGITTLLPQMADSYSTYELTEHMQEQLTELMNSLQEKQSPHATDLSEQIVQLLPIESAKQLRKSALTQGMVLTVHQGDCFPVDCILLNGATLIDAAILTGEPRQGKLPTDFIPAGAINLGSEVLVYAVNDSYNSTVNQLLFNANRAREKDATSTPPYLFTYLYLALIAAGIITSVVIPFSLGILTIPLLLQNITGILFAICPCTLGIAHELPNLLNSYYHQKNGIRLNAEHLNSNTTEIHTVVFDKTGTLTTGNSAVDSHEGISDALWQRIYLLEKNYGAEHPLAKAISDFYERTWNSPILFNDMNSVCIDPKNRGLSGLIQGKTIHIGSADFLRHAGIDLPATYTPLIANKLALGYTAIYIAENCQYQGVILIKHEIKSEIVASLTRLKNEGKKLLMLTGDSRLSATGLNQQYDSIFDPDNIIAEQTPQNKEAFLKDLMSKTETPQGLWFIGDGLNDAPSSRIVSEKGGVSCAMKGQDKSAFFTDLSLNGGLDYLFKQRQLKQFLQKIILQNQALLIYSTLAFLAFILTFSAAGIAVSPLIPLCIMVSTTLLTLFNSYRVSCSIEVELSEKISWFKQFLTSDWSIGLIMGAGTLFLTSLLASSLITGTLAVPTLLFTTVGVAAFCSAFMLASCTLLGIVVTLGVVSLLMDISNEEDTVPTNPVPMKSTLQAKESMPLVSCVKEYDFGFKPIRDLDTHENRDSSTRNITPLSP